MSWSTPNMKISEKNIHKNPDNALRNRTVQIKIFFENNIDFPSLRTNLKIAPGFMLILRFPNLLYVFLIQVIKLNEWTEN